MKIIASSRLFRPLEPKEINLGELFCERAVQFDKFLADRELSISLPVVSKVVCLSLPAQPLMSFKRNYSKSIAAVLFERFLGDY